MEQVCALYGISRQGHYQMLRRERQRQKDAVLILEMVHQIRREHPQMGTRKLHHELQPMLAHEGLKFGRDQLFDLLREAELLVKRPKSYRRTTFSGWWRTPNLLPGLRIERPNQVWVGDITYLETESQPFVYLFLLMDLFSRYIVGWHVADSLAATGAHQALEMAFSSSQSDLAGLIHHSDHGVQYTSHGYLERLQQAQVLPSMGEVGNCYDNAHAERVIGTLKREYLLQRRMTDIAQARHLAEQAIWSYNSSRPHLSLNYAYPFAVYSGLVVDIAPVCYPTSEEVALLSS